MSLIQRMILYLFPLYLTTMEQIIRTIFDTEVFSVSTVASSISVGGLALLLPFLVPSPYHEGLKQELIEDAKRNGATIISTKDQNIATSAWIFLISLTFVWIYSLSKKAELTTVINVHQYNITVPILVAFITYLIGIVHTELMERG
jgi:hypothetical protein